MVTTIFGNVSAQASSQPYQNFAERASSSEEQRRRQDDETSFNLWVCMPCEVVSFNATQQTIVAKPLLMQNIVDRQTGQKTWVQIENLVDVPVSYPQFGGFILTGEPQPGDECIVLFADSQIDFWFQNGGAQNYNDRRRHDLSDGIAIFGPNSVPKTLASMNAPITPNAMEMRSKDGTTRVSISPTLVTLQRNSSSNVNEQIYLNDNGITAQYGSYYAYLDAGGNIAMNAANITLTAAGSINIVAPNTNFNGTNVNINTYNALNIINSVGTMETYGSHVHQYTGPGGSQDSTLTATNPYQVPT